MGYTKELKLALFVISLISTLSFAQTDRDFPARYSLKSSKDTVSTYLKNNLGFRSKAYSPHLWVGEMTFISSEGKKVVIGEHAVDYLELTDHEGRVRKFVSPPALGKPKLYLLEVNHEGKLGMYTDYYIDRSSRELAAQQFLVEEGKNPILVISHGRLFDPKPSVKRPSQLNVGFYNSFRKKLKERLNAYPDLIDRVEEMKTYEDLFGILEDYNRR